MSMPARLSRAEARRFLSGSLKIRGLAGPARRGARKPKALPEALGTAGPPGPSPARPCGLDSLGTGAAPQGSPLERALDADLALFGVVAPQRDEEYGIVDLEGKPRRFRFDRAWRDLMLAVEVQGGTWSRGAHGRPSNLERDAWKFALAALNGWTVIPVTSKMIASHKATALILRALEMKRARDPSLDARPGGRSESAPSS